GQDVKLFYRNTALALAPADMDHRLQYYQRHSHVGRVRSNTLIATTQHGVNAIETFQCSASGARLALVAGINGIAEVVAASELHQIKQRGASGDEDGVGLVNKV